VGNKLFSSLCAIGYVTLALGAAIAGGCGGDTSPSEPVTSIDAGAGTPVHLPVTGGTGGSGGSGSTPVVGDETAADAPSCTPASVDTWKPMWSPPKPPISACSKEQIDSLYAKCDYGSPAYNRAACRTFQTDPANQACDDCMFSVDGDPSYGAIIILPSGVWWSNYGGCMAMVDGDATATGCGAKNWAVTECRDNACTACSGDNWNDCMSTASKTVCAPYAHAAVCGQRPTYALCSYPTWKEQFIGYGAMFCSAGLEGGAPRDAAPDSGAPASDSGSDGSDF
jgi:hypothetical protein